MWVQYWTTVTCNTALHVGTVLENSDLQQSITCGYSARLTVTCNTALNKDTVLDNWQQTVHSQT